MINVQIVRRFGNDYLMSCGGASGCVLFDDGWTDVGGLWSLVIPLFVMVSATRLIVANAIAGAMHIYLERAGSLSAFTSATQYGTGIFGSGLDGLFGNGTPAPMSTVIVVLCIGCAACKLFVVKNQRRSAT